MHTYGLEYDRIIITGASSGFGHAFAQRLAARTKELYLIARSKDALTELANTLEKEHEHLRAHAMPCDLTDDTALNELLTALESLPPARTLLINNAGCGDYGEFAAGERHVVRRLLRLNMESLTMLCHALIPAMKRHGGDIINISSLAAMLPIPDFAVYAASKSYVSSLSEALRLELKEDGIRVVAVCPGPVTTGFGKAARRPGFTGNMMPGRQMFDTTIPTVVESALKALSKGKARVFPGLKIRLSALFINAMPLPILRLVMGKRPRKVVLSQTLPK